MTEPRIARASAVVDAPVAKVWEAFVTPALIKQYMFGTNVTSSWKPGSPIQWQGEWQGRAYVDKGTILDYQPPRLLRYTHFSPLTGLPDVPENYHTVTIRLSEDGSKTQVALEQDNNPTEEARQHNEQGWKMMFDGLKKLLEGHAG